MNSVNMETASYDIIVIYHDNCLDGFGAAYAAWKKFGTTADYLHWSYERSATELPYIEGKDIYIVDFSFKPDDIAIMLTQADNITIIDHHKTFIEAVESNGYCDEDGEPWPNLDIHYDINKSGAVLAWEFFHDVLSVPQLLLHIQDRDLWQFKLAGTKEICAALANKYVVARSFEAWDELVKAFDTDDTEVIHNIYVQGRAILAAQQQLIDECIVTASEPFIDNFGFKVIACNAPMSIASELGNRIANENPDCIALIWHTNDAENYTKYSLRSVGDVDCTELAKKFGGGGHKNAAGFVIRIDSESNNERIE